MKNVPFILWKNSVDFWANPIHCYLSLQNFQEGQNQVSWPHCQEQCCQEKRPTTPGACLTPGSPSATAEATVVPPSSCPGRIAVSATGSCLPMDSQLILSSPSQFPVHATCKGAWERFLLPTSEVQLRRVWSDFYTLVNSAISTVVPPYPWRYVPRPLSGCLKSWIVSNPVYTGFFSYIYLRMIKLNL